jgi:DNA-binding NarL/FixJ family response regulator
MRTASTPLNVVLADDSYLVREALRHLLALAPDIELVATCCDAEELMAAVERESPNVVLSDIRMPPLHEREGIRIAAQLRETHPEIGVVLLSQYEDPTYALELFESGSEGRAYLLKDRIGDLSELVDAIQAVADGRSVVDVKIIDGLIAERRRSEQSSLEELTAREREVLGGLAAGKSNTAIADALSLTKRAVEKHINAIFMKLGLQESDDVSRRVKAALIYLAD